MLATNYAEAGGFLKTDPSLPAPDVQLHFVVALVDDHARNFRMAHGYSCHVCVLRPKSRGEVTLASADMRQAPLIDPAFLSEEEDLETLVKGYKLTRKLMNTPALASVRQKDIFTADVHTDDEIRHMIRERADTVYHPVGTCKMGSDSMAVVDAELKVHGVEGLRVVDGSIMPTVIGGNTNAPIIAIAEKACDMIRLA
jgi:choline dehydrogenase-like flavoprotein